MGDIAIAGSVNVGARKASKLKVFISYSRKDLDFAQAIVVALEARGLAPKIDTRDLPKLEDWRSELLGFIHEADAVVFVVSPDSISSPVCSWEIEQVAKLNKRLAPIILKRVPDERIPQAIAKINYLFFDGSEAFERQADELAKALQTDLVWLKEHTRIGELARRWAVRLERSPVQSEALLLRDSELFDAEQWISRRPGDSQEPTEQHRAFVTASRMAQQRRDARSRRNSRVLATGSISVALVLAVLGGLFFHAWRGSERRQSLFLADLSRQNLKNGDAGTAMLLAIEALPDRLSGSFLSFLRPYVPEAQLALDIASRHMQEQFLIPGDGHFISKAQFSPDGHSMIAISPTDPVPVIWDCRTHQPLFRLIGHTGGVLDAAYAPDGRSVVTGSVDKTARVWTLEAGKAPAILSGHEEPLRKVAWSRDGRTILTLAGDTGRTWDAQTGKPLAVIRGIRSAAFSPDGKTITSFSNDQFSTVGLWRAASGQELTPPEHPSSVVFSPDGQVVLTLHGDTAPHLRQSDSMQDIAVLAGHENVVSGAAFTADGTLVVTSSFDTTARIWDVKTGALLVVLRGHEAPISAAIFNVDGSRVITLATDRSANIWETASGKLIATLRDPKSWKKVLFSPDGKTVLTLDQSDTARLWHVETGRQLAAIEEEVIFVFSADGGTLLTLPDMNGDSVASLWDTATGQRFALLRGHEAQIINAAFSPDSKTIVTMSLDGTLRLWSRDPKPTEQRPLTSGMWKSTADGRKSLRPYSGEQGDVIKLRNNLTGTIIATLKVEGENLNDAGFDPSGRLVVTHADKIARLWDSETGAHLLALNNDEYVTAAAFSNDSKKLATASSDGAAHVWDVQTGKLLAICKGHEATVNSVAFSADGTEIVTASDDRTAAVWNAMNGRMLSRFFDPEPKQTIALSSGQLKDAAISPDARRILTVGYTGEIRVWDIATEKVIAELGDYDSYRRHASFAADGAVIADGQGHTVRWEIPSTEVLVDRSKADVPRCLTPGQREKFFLSSTIPNWCLDKRLYPFGYRSPPRLSEGEWIMLNERESVLAVATSWQ